MAKLAKEWIEKNFKLSRELEPLERSLSDGYIFLSICKQKNLIDEIEFESAINDKRPESAIINFKLLSKVLVKLGLKLTKQDVANVIFSIYILAYILIIFYYKNNNI